MTISQLDLIFLIIYIIIFIIGNIGNLMVILVYTNEGYFNKNPIYLTFISVALVNMLLLWVACFDFGAFEAILQVTQRSTLSCKLYNIIYRALLISHAWLVLPYSIYRY